MKTVLLGDSITQGLGSKKVNFLDELKGLLPGGDEVLNLALTGTTIDYAQQILPDIEQLAPDFVVILYGNVDAMLKPSRTGKVFRWLPPRFNAANGSMLLPRPFYSSAWHKRAAQKVENGMRTIFRNLIFAIDGTEQWMPLKPYMATYQNVCHALRVKGTRPVICSTVFIDDRLFPGSAQEYARYNAWMQAYAAAQDVPYIDFFTIFQNLVFRDGWRRYYNADHFHPNGEGYRVMAREIANTLRIEASRCAET